MARVTTTRSQILVQPMGTTVYRRQHFMESSSSHSSRGRIAEVAGGTAAECAAVFCCCPCTLVNLVVLAVYKLPAGICRKALRKHKRQRMIKQGLFPLSSSTTSSEHGSCRCHSWDQDEFHMGLASVPEGPEVTMFFMEGNEVDNELMELEKQMWDKFCNTGFWRSPSQREL